MQDKDKLISVKIPSYLYDIIKGMSEETHVPIQKLTEILLTKSPKIKHVLKNIE